jgi:hypothetical protein
MLSVIMLSVIMLNVLMVNVLMLNVIMLNVIMMRVVAPFLESSYIIFILFKKIQQLDYWVVSLDSIWDYFVREIVG